MRIISNQSATHAGSSLITIPDSNTKLKIESVMLTMGTTEGYIDLLDGTTAFFPRFYLAANSVIFLNTNNLDVVIISGLNYNNSVPDCGIGINYSILGEE